MRARRASWLVVAYLAGCGGGPRADAGFDSGPRETGPLPPVVCGSVASSRSIWPALPAACLPRCSAATLSTVEACAGDEACTVAGLDADATPAEVLDHGMDTIVAIACGDAASDRVGCVGWQSRSCFADHCPAELAGYLECERRVGGPGPARTMCTAESSAIGLCQMASASVLGACFDERVRPCFAP